LCSEVPLRKRQKTKQSEEGTMQTEKVSLYYQQGGSDKVYHLQLETTNGTWSVYAQWGRRGSALQSDTKLSNATYEDAKRAYDRVFREKTGKGYQIAEATADGAAISVGLPSTKELSGHVPELLTPLEEPEALKLIDDSSWWFQKKFDGRRLAVQKANGKYAGINKLGQIVPVDAQLAKFLDRVEARSFLVDGEITGSRFFVWDLLAVNDTDLRTQPYEVRFVRLTEHFLNVGGPVSVVRTAMTSKSKRAFVQLMHNTNAEGFVCKNRNAPYAGGRAGQHYKCKFVSTASFIVGPKPDKKAADGHRSIAVYLLDGHQERFMGTVGVPERYPLPKDGEIVEIRYLYCHPGPDGKLIQAKYFGQVRNDIERTECSVSQLKLKAEEAATDES
jgi:bifunctional non-homologous end joining protein LigD